jgi:hypothetical protein
LQSGKMVRGPERIGFTLIKGKISHQSCYPVQRYMLSYKNAKNYNGSEQRNSTDRRKKPTNPFSRYAFRGRRKTIRRAEDRRRHPYTDQYSRRLLLVALLIMLLCVADALFTLLHVSEGAIELNPLMDGLLQKGPLVFFVVKFTLTACGLLLLVIYRHHPLGRIATGSMLLLYATLFAYQIHLFFRQVP